MMGGREGGCAVVNQGLLGKLNDDKAHAAVDKVFSSNSNASSERISLPARN